MQTVRQRLTASTQGSLLFCDVDYFKQVNDTHGHAVGDLILGEIARILGRHGAAGRIGGDEFALWLDVDIATAAQIAHRILGEVSAALSGHEAGVPAAGLSIGIAEAPTHGRELGALMQAADEALYGAKHAGRARVSLAGSPAVAA